MAAIDLDAIGKLGFGLMRLPKRAGRIDIDETSRMVDAFLEAGGTYFDTAFVYPGSEKAMRKALVERHPRESYTIATKLFATAVPTAGLAKKELATSLSRAGTGYVDFYLLHSLMDANWKKYERFGLWDFVAEERDKGTIRHYGFSFHGGPELLDRLPPAHPDAQFVRRLGEPERPGQGQLGGGPRPRQAHRHHGAREGRAPRRPARGGEGPLGRGQRAPGPRLEPCLLGPSLRGLARWGHVRPERHER